MAIALFAGISTHRCWYCVSDDPPGLFFSDEIPMTALYRDFKAIGPGATSHPSVVAILSPILSSFFIRAALFLCHLVATENISNAPSLVNRSGKYIPRCLRSSGDVFNASPNIRSPSSSNTVGMKPSFTANCIATRLALRQAFTMAGL